MKYYILENGTRNGPYDIMSMVKKIRNNRLAPTTQVMTDEMEQPTTADLIPSLMPFFSDIEDVKTEEAYRPEIVNLNLILILRDAWRLFAENTIITTVSAGVLFSTMFGGFLLSMMLPPFIAVFFASIVWGIGFSAMTVYALRRIRGQDSGFSFWQNLFQQHGKKLLVSATLTSGILFGIPSVLGLLISEFFFLFNLVSLLVYALFVLAPLMMFDHPELSAIDALKRSKNWIWAQGYDNIGVICMLVFFNAVAFILFLVPIFISLPITALAFAAIYEYHIISQA